MKTTGDPLRKLLVIDRLEVGPPKVEPRSIKTPYRVVSGDEESVHELAYRYEEDVLDPDSPADQNLAEMITAQVALNYGLFCREIVFRGPFDAKDQRFLRDMMANTAREIYVKKLLEPNPFLTDAVEDLPTENRKSFVLAEVRFPDDAEPVETGWNEIGWETEPERVAVSSSGGKDSLLSYGLLHELGGNLVRNVAPVFLNESGRHWLTARNAYRHFQDAVPGTSRVWTSSDRLFSAMLRHLPFVRPDFARRRADEYPIRLWTVAVFLFGALPIVRARRAGRLIVGDEYDTTIRARHGKIPHHDGLFDQSRFFDEAMSRYFGAKGWGVTQFSLLRPLSELLIQKILAERYPELLKLQVSCHAAHKDGDISRPCGRCEKCRRIVGMLLALDTDPAVCGYSPEQVQAARVSLVENGVHQERPGAEHLTYLLDRRKLLSTPRLGKAKAHPRPEIVSLRFHPERSPMAGLPVALRRPLFQLFLEHAEGSLRRVGRNWLPIDPSRDPEIDRPYPFDRPQSENEDDNASPGHFLWGEMTWPEAKARLRTTDTALLPVGAIEQHGHHLPLDTDAFDADYLAREVARGCSDPKPLVLPLLPYGVSYHHEDFPGTISLTNETMARVVYEVGMAAARNGIAKLVVINGHGGNGPTLHFAAQMINRDAHIFTCVESGETSDSDIEEMTETENDVHAGEVETSTTLAIRPELVRMANAHADVPRFSSHYLDFTSQQSVGWYARTAKISASGVMGDPEKATAEKGEAIWRVMIANLVELVEHIKDLSLEEIYQRRH